MASIGFLEAFIAVFSFLLFCYFLSKKPFGFLAIKKDVQSNVLWNWPVLGMLPGLLMRMHWIENSFEILENSNCMGRMRAIWGEDASEYKPERWISEAGKLRHEPSHKFFAFNSGPRTFLGKHIAMFHLKTIVIEILQNYDVKVVQGQKIEPELGFILYIKDGLKVTLTKR